MNIALPGWQRFEALEHQIQAFPTRIMRMCFRSLCYNKHEHVGKAWNRDACIFACAHTHTHTHVHTRIHMHTHTHTHSHTHTHTPFQYNTHLTHPLVLAGGGGTFVYFNVTIRSSVPRITSTRVQIIANVTAITIHAGGQMTAGVYVNITQGPRIALLTCTVIRMSAVAMF